MRRITLSVLIVVALLALASAADAAKGHKKTLPTCPSAHARTMLADAQAEVYLLPEHFGGRGGVEPTEIFGCAFDTRRSYVLGEPTPKAGTPSGISGITLETLSGTIVAYEAGSGGPTGADWVVVVRDLSTGKVLHSVPTGTPAHPKPPRVEGGLTIRDVGIGPAKSIVVKSDGAVAWIAQDAVEGSTYTSYQVHALDKTGSRVLASGPNIEPHSLALAGSTLYWTEGGKPMSAALN